MIPCTCPNFCYFHTTRVQPKTITNFTSQASKSCDHCYCGTTTVNGKDHVVCCNCSCKKLIGEDVTKVPQQLSFPFFIVKGELNEAY